MVLLFVIIFALVIWLTWYIAKQFFAVAEAKGHHSRKYLWICFWLTIVGYLLVIALPDRGTNASAVSDVLPEL